MYKVSILAIASLVCHTGCESNNTTPEPPQAPSVSASARATPATASTTPTASATPTAPPRTQADAAPADSPANASNAFSFALHKLLPTEGNLTYSPASISVALAMTYAGAKGNTESQMASAMRFPKKGDALHSGWSTLLKRWRAIDDVEIAVANRLYGAKQIEFAPAFIGLTKDRYLAPLVASDFLADPEAERQRINDWVLEQTQQRIRDLIPGGGISADTRLALVNAMYFKAKWATPFDTNQTTKAPFAAPNGEIQTQMMSQTGSMAYASVDNVAIVERSYAGDEFAAVFVLPAENTKLAELESQLDEARFDKWIDALEEKTVSMKLPRFELSPTETMELSGKLQQLGMTDAFDPGRADFTAMTTKPDDRPAFDKVYHKAFVAMDEAGTEAAAATAVVMGPGGAAPSDEVEFHADRPFLFFVRDTTSGLVLFSGRVVEPSPG